MKCTQKHSGEFKSSGITKSDKNNAELNVLPNMTSGYWPLLLLITYVYMYFEVCNAL